MTDDARLNDLIAAYHAAAAGHPRTPEEVCRDCPHLLDRLRLALSGTTFRFDPSPTDPPSTVPHQPQPDSQPPAPPGYEFDRVLGRGGMGVVYLARHVKLKRHVALKMIRGPVAGDAELARFRAEAEAMARLQHPNIVQVFEVGEHAGHPFLALEYVPGGSLAGKLSAGPLPPKVAAAVVETLARAVQHAHDRGVVHRDLKPANVLIAADGTPKVTDFGLAKFTDDGSGQTHTGTVMGTPAYMSPEQAAGKTRQIGPATDVYALGVILYELLTGTVPFRGESMMETLHLVMRGNPTPPSEIQRYVEKVLEYICLTAMKAETSKRYNCASALSEDLKKYLANMPVAVSRSTPKMPAEDESVSTLWYTATVASSRQQSSSPRREARLGSQLWVAIAVCGGLLGMSAIFIASQLLRGQTDSTLTSESAKKWYVGKPGSGGPNERTFLTLSDAVRKAGTGDTILLTEDITDSYVQLEATNRCKGLTIESADPTKPVKWEPVGGGSTLLVVRNLDSFALRRVVIVLNGHYDTGLSIAGAQMRAELSDVGVSGAKGAGLVMDVSGTADHPVEVNRLRVSASKVGVHLRAKPPSASRQIRLDDLRIDGVAKAGVQIDGLASQVVVTHARIADAEVGVLLTGGHPAKAAPGGENVRVAGCTFYKTTDAVRVHQEKEADWVLGEVLVERCLFVSAGAVLGGKPVTTVKLTGNARADTKDADTKTREVKADVGTDPADDATFLRYAAGSPLEKAIDGQAVGVPPGR